MFRDAAQRLQRFEHVGFGFPILGLQLAGEILAEDRRAAGVEQGKHLKRLFQVRWEGAVHFERLNLPVNR